MVVVPSTFCYLSRGLTRGGQAGLLVGERAIAWILRMSLQQVRASRVDVANPLLATSVTSSFCAIMRMGFPIPLTGTRADRGGGCCHWAGCALCQPRRAGSVLRVEALTMPADTLRPSDVAA